jgi:hypothetical protein
MRLGVGHERFDVNLEKSGIQRQLICEIIMQNCDSRLFVAGKEGSESFVSETVMPLGAATCTYQMGGITDSSMLDWEFVA